MLLLTREQGEAIYIMHGDEKILLKLFYHHYKNRIQIRVGIEAPQSFKIMREELMDKEDLC